MFEPVNVGQQFCRNFLSKQGPLFFVSCCDKDSFLHNSLISISAQNFLLLMSLSNSGPSLFSENFLILFYFCMIPFLDFSVLGNGESWHWQNFVCLLTICFLFPSDFTLSLKPFKSQIIGIFLFVAYDFIWVAGSPVERNFESRKFWRV